MIFLVTNLSNMIFLMPKNSRGYSDIFVVHQNSLTIFLGHSLYILLHFSKATLSLIRIFLYFWVKDIKKLIFLGLRESQFWYFWVPYKIFGLTPPPPYANIPSPPGFISFPLLLPLGSQEWRVELVELWTEAQVRVQVDCELVKLLLSDLYS